MVDSINGPSPVSRGVSAPQTQGLRNNPLVLNAIVQSQQKKSSAVVPVAALAVPQSSKTGNGSNVKLPRGSLVDVIA